MKIGFIGLGKMGTGMARNLSRAGHQISAYNRSRAKAEALAADGIQPSDTIAAACRDSEAVFTMVADDHALDAIVFGEGGLAASLPTAAAHISSSTVSAALARRLTAEHAARGQGFLSAPVFGRPEAAESKQLVVVAGGPANLTDRFQLLLEAIGRQVFVAGPEPWQANAVKLCGNFMIASMLETFSEAYATLRKAEVDPHLFLEVINALFGSQVYANYGRIIADEKFDPPGFPVPLGLKDVCLILETAQECASPMPIASLVRDQLLSALAQGQAALDWASVSKVAARNAGL